ncbi:exodeoxyribonuclease 7 large subunit [Cupriavidus necator N-1]|uniref:Exodeoxyribonuclease 7 large subunit n=1 Tax=Cupriavidus necator (strain ATCC 43291 / DSM 13513 / CCUG 52238 / LMG 8453 / N-1) TaxID=1042878 RepID=G0EWS9_CUPNN|nr:exodeoxyribonuclease 7 large subunit [Cupriavidus necator N-1]
MASGVNGTCPQHNRYVKGVALMPAPCPERRMGSSNPLILMSFTSKTKIRQYNQFSFASITYIAPGRLVHKVIHSFSG